MDKLVRRNTVSALDIEKNPFDMFQVTCKGWWLKRYGKQEQGRKLRKKKDEYCLEGDCARNKEGGVSN